MKFLFAALRLFAGGFYSLDLFQGAAKNPLTLEADSRRLEINDWTVTSHQKY